MTNDFGPNTEIREKTELAKFYEHEMAALQEQLKEALAWKAVAQTSITKLEERIEAIADERNIYRKALESVRDDPNKHPAVQKFIDGILAQYPSPIKIDQK